jgi:tetratricopeptide repeat protein 21B
VTDLETMQDEAKYLVLLSKVYKRQDRMEDSLQSMNKARDMQARVLKRVQVEQPDGVPAQRKFASK